MPYTYIFLRLCLFSIILLTSCKIYVKNYVIKNNVFSMITFSDFTINLKKRLKSLIFLINLAVILALGLSFIQPFLYKTNFSVLIIQDNKDTTDVYTSIKSADKLGGFLQKIVKTSDFQNAVMSSGYNISKDDFSTSEKKKRKQWNKMIDVNLVSDAGILDFNVYYKNRAGAEEYANAIIHTLSNDGPQFYGGSDVIKFKVINSPLTSINPAKPNILFNVIFALMVGSIGGIFYVYFTTVEVNRKDVVYEEDGGVESGELRVESEGARKSENIILSAKNSIETVENLKEEVEPVILEVEKPVVNNVVENKIVDEKLNENESIKVIYDDEYTPSNGFIKSMNDRVKDIIK